MTKTQVPAPVYGGQRKEEARVMEQKKKKNSERDKDKTSAPSSKIEDEERGGGKVRGVRETLSPGLHRRRDRASLPYQRLS